MSKIVTITFNPCIDKSTTVPGLAPEKKLRCTAPRFEPGGGGLNVARAIKKLGGEAIAIYPVGGHSGAFLEQLVQQEGLSSNVVHIKNHTRENLIVLDTTINQQYRFGMPGPFLFDEEWQQCLALVAAQKDAAFVIASGSLPPGVPLSIFSQLAILCREQGAKLIVDTSGDALKQAAKEGVYMLKPNLAELSALAGKLEINAEHIDEIARAVINSGQCEVIIVSLGPAGAVLVTKDEAIQVVSPVVKRKSTVGAGDSMIAGVVLSLTRGAQLKEALQYGVACGTAATMNPGTELCRLEDVEKLVSIIRR